MFGSKRRAEKAAERAAQHQRIAEAYARLTPEQQKKYLALLLFSACTGPCGMAAALVYLFSQGSAPAAEHN